MVLDLLFRYDIEVLKISIPEKKILAKIHIYIIKITYKIHSSYRCSYSMREVLLRSTDVDALIEVNVFSTRGQDIKTLI